MRILYHPRLFPLLTLRFVSHLQSLAMSILRSLLAKVTDLTHVMSAEHATKGFAERVLHLKSLARVRCCVFFFRALYFSLFFVMSH